MNLKLLKIHLIILLLLIIIFSCHKENKNVQTGNKDSTDKSTDFDKIKKEYSLKDFFSDDSLLNVQVNRIFNSLNYSEKIAQMIITSTGIGGKQVDIVNKLILNKKVGGVILMGGSKDLCKSIINKFNTVAETNNSIPLLYAIDAEPGLIGKKITGVFNFPPQSKIKSINEVDTIASKISVILKELKININFAPVCDISVNKEIISDRSFGNDSKKIIEFSTAFINATQRKNVIATVKHFPGHGNVVGDSHKEAVYIDGELTELENFKNIINSGVLAVMIGHIAVKNNKEYQTDGVPSTLSRNIVTGLLRNKLGFKGLIVTDALNMGAVVKFDKPAFNSAVAGCDLLLMPTDEIKLLKAILSEANKNPDFKNQINESIKRIIKVKICLGLIKN